MYELNKIESLSHGNFILYKFKIIETYKYKIFDS